MSDTSKIRQLRALVLGGRGDIGLAISKKLQGSGMDVFAAGRADFDLGDPHQIARFFEHQSNSFDVLVHCAGVNHPKAFLALTDSEIRESLDVNLHGFLRITKWCLPHWQKTGFGRVVVISSLYGTFGRHDRLPYVISKHALNGAVKTLAIELASDGVLVNALSPGYIETKMTQANNPPATIERLIGAIPLRRLGSPEDIAEVAAFLCSPGNRYLTGQDIVVDGGFSAGGFQG